MRVVVVTPVAVQSVQFLPELIDSFRREVAALPADVQAVWRLQVDGAEEIVADRVRAGLEDCPAGCTVGWAGRQRGAAYTRTVGLLDEVSRLPGEVQPDDVVVTIDADDLWLPDGLTRLIEPLRRDPAVTWVGAGNTWIDEMGFTTDVYAPLGGLDGDVPPGALRAAWLRSGIFPFAASCVAYRLPVILARGGWPASPSGEDAVLLVGVSDSHPGFAVTDPLFAYRQHANQTTRSLQHAELRPLTRLLMEGMAPRSD